MEHSQQQRLAYMLADELQKATGKFARRCPAININGILGAANIFLATWHVHAPSKEVALQDVEKSFDIIRNVLANTPAEFFGKSGRIANPPKKGGHDA